MTPETLIERQVRRVARRLWLQALFQRLVVCWCIGLGALACGLAVRALFWGHDPLPVRWGLFAAVWVSASVVAIAWNVLRSPKPVAAALALDERFELRERVTTWLTSSPEQKASPAGLALREDVVGQVEKLDVPARFALEFGWRRLAATALATGLALAALLFTPTLSFNAKNTAERTKVDVKEVQLQLDNLKKVVHIPKKDEEKSKELKELEDQWDKILKKEVDPKNEDQVRETIQQLRDLEEKMKDRIENLKQQAEKNQNLKNALDQLAKNDLGKLDKDGPAKDLNDALAQKDMQQAANQLDKLAKKLADKNLSKEEQAKLQQQTKELQDLFQKLHDLRKQEQDKMARELQQLRERLDELEKDQDLKKVEDALDKDDFQKAIDEVDKLKKKAKSEDLAKQLDELKQRLEKMLKEPPEQRAREMQQLKDRLQKLADRMQRELDDGRQLADRMQRELDQLDQELDDLDELQDIEDLLEECEKCLGKGDSKGAAGKLMKLKGRLERLKLTEEEIEKLLQDQERLDEICLGLMNALRQGQGMGGKSKLPGGVRPVGPEPNSKTVNERQKADVDPTGKLRITGTAKGGTFSKVPARDVGGVFKQAVQEAPEAIDRQRIPAEAADIAKGYFQKLGGQK